MSKAKAAAPPRSSPPTGPGAATPYDKDVILWSQEQATLLRAGRFEDLDIEHLADEIEDVGKSERRELASRMAVLLAHLLKWSRQPGKRTNGWRATIAHQRKRIALSIKETPSLKTVMRDRDWQEAMWLDAVVQAARETGFEEDDFPDSSPWTMDLAADPDFWPD
jgi:hypothetical protein